ncbi:MAG: toxin-antitoxin system HicB family antitoxin [Chitinivibrionales bacterium]|nr:toxin-antitoxin system HicB family antitoxin [Chitinivibrionales bacterium]
MVCECAFASNSEYMITSNIRDFRGGELKGFGSRLSRPEISAISGGRKMNKSLTLTVRMPAELKKRLEREAKYQGVPLNQLTN